MEAALVTRFADLLRSTAKQHHDAFAATDGDDPDWAIWYAERLYPTVTEDFGFTVSKSELIECLLQAAHEHEVRAPDEDWPTFYATLLLDRLAPAMQGEEQLALYHYSTCPFCMMVKRVVDELGIDVEFRDVVQDPKHRGDLIGARGRATVPVLRIMCADGTDRWMPESRDIIRYLRHRYG